MDLSLAHCSWPPEGQLFFRCLQSALTIVILVLSLERGFESAVTAFHFVAGMCWARSCSIQRYIKLLKTDKTNAFGRNTDLWEIFTLERCISQQWNSCGPARQDTSDRVLYYFCNYLYCTILPLLPCMTKSLPWAAECSEGAVTCMASLDIACGGYIRIMDQRFRVFWSWCLLVCFF